MKNLKLFLIMFLFIFTFTQLTPSSVVHAECQLVINPKTEQWAIKGANGKYVDERNQNHKTNVKIKECISGQQDFDKKLMTFTWVLMTFSSVSAVISIIHSGIKYINSEGNSYVVEEAKKQMWFTAVGLFVILSAVTIVNLIAMAAG